MGRHPAPPGPERPGDVLSHLAGARRRGGRHRGGEPAMSLVLLALVALPLGGALALLFGGRLAGSGAAAPEARASIERVAAPFATAVSGVVLLFALLSLTARPWASGRPAAEVDLRWVPALGLRFHLGLDGISAPLVLLTVG